MGQQLARITVAAVEVVGGDTDAVPRTRHAPIRPRTIVPVHSEAWKHFAQGRLAIEREFAQAPEDIRRRVRRLPVGASVRVEDPLEPAPR
jgi:hypothetical protein